MGVRRWVASKDTTITNAFKENLVNRATDANMGASDIVEVFSIFGQESSASLEASRILVQFPVENIIADRVAGNIPASGSVSFYLNLSNAPHGETTPKDFDLVTAPVGRTWKEGYGLDMERYNDLGAANWIQAVSTEEEAGSSFGTYTESILRETTHGRSFGNSRFIDYDDDSGILVSSLDPGNESLSGPFESGSAAVYRSGSDGWYREDIIEPLEAKTGTFSSRLVSVSVNGSKIALGNDQGSGSFHENQGAVYIYASSSAGWSLEQKITASTGSSTTFFGNTTLLAGDKLFVGDSAFSTGSSHGIVWIFNSASSGWELEAQITSSENDAFESFGEELSFCQCGNNAVFVGAYFATGTVSEAGAVFLFASGSTGWKQEAKISASDGALGDGFGDSVDMKNNILYVSAPWHATGSLIQGSVYVYESSSAQGFVEVQKITSSIPQAGGRFGRGLKANDKGWLLISQPSEVFADSGTKTVPINYLFLYESSSLGQWNFRETLFTQTSSVQDVGVSVAMGSDVLFASLRNIALPASSSEKPSIYLREYNVLNWENQGGDCLSSPVYTSSFSLGDEDLSIDITDLVENWISGAIDNNGVCVKLTPTFEESLVDSFFTKRFFGRRSEHFFKVPWIEARFDDSVKDNRNNFYVSSSLVPAEDNLMTLMLYNRTRKGLRNIPAVGNGPIYMSLYSGTLGPEGAQLLLHTGELSITGGAIDTGIYTASVAIDTQAERLFDVWHNNLTGTARINYFTGSVIFTNQYSGSDQFEISDYVLNITNLKPSYTKNENARFRLFTRLKDWNPTIYTIAVADIENQVIEDAYYKIFRVADDFDVIPYGTGSNNHTLLSFDKDGNYFDFDMSLLEPDYQYGIQFLFKLEDEYHEQKETFKFRVR